jgi:Xaa-Pro aminopeptidase
MADSVLERAASGSEPPYAGDANLARLLATAGSPYDLAGLETLVAGVLAGSAAADWTRLVAPKVPPELAAELDGFAARRARAITSQGLGAAERLARLRAELARRGLDGFIVPRADEHQGEYVPLRAKRLAWLTGFTGSAGLAIVLADKAAIFTDGRYTLQVRSEVDGALYEYRHLTEQPATEWIAQHLERGRLGYDPWLHVPGEVERFAAAAAKAGGQIIAVDGNPVDAVWPSQPSAPIAPVVPHELRFAGKSAAEKRHEVAELLVAEGADATVLSAPDSIAWLLNIRGGDVARTPLPLSFAILDRSGAVELFIDRRKLVAGIESHLGNGVAVQPPAHLGAALDRLGAQKKRVLVDPASAAFWIFDRLGAAGAVVQRAADPCQLPKACKNPVELAGTRVAHRRDGAALTKYLAWLAHEAPSGRLREIEASDRLEAFRRGGENFRDLSFSTISGAGSNGAIVHYRATPETEKVLEPGSLYLVDSGAQYLDGTTDVTRTVAIGTPTAEMKDRFTRVLKGHIALATTRFPKGTTGSQLDVLARHALWQAGLDFDHGTGHGVGSYLAVHEGPQRISKLPNTQPLLPGMIVSNEPGYYKTGGYGIRIENLVIVTESTALPGAERPMFEFETLTLAPIDRNAIAPEMLTAEERAWLDAYHARVREALTPLLDPTEAAWLATATAPIG